MKRKQARVAKATHSLARTIGELFGDDKLRYNTNNVEAYSAFINSMPDDDLRTYAADNLGLNFSVCDSRENILYTLRQQFSLYWRSHQSKSYREVSQEVRDILAIGK